MSQPKPFILSATVSRASLWVMLLAGLCACSLPAQTPPGRIFSVKDYGATGQKEDDAGPAIQKAIEACSTAGGGTVFFPAGLYTSGTVHLRSHIRIELAAGATLFASTDPKAYHPGPIPSKAGLLVGEDLEDISFAGSGIVDGQAQYVWRLDDFEQNFDHKTRMQSLGKPVMRSFPQGFPERQIYPHLVWLGRCKDIRVTGLSFLHSPSWTFALYDCERALFDGLYIYTSLKEAVWADGIDLDGCRDVRVSNCTIETGDDCVALVSENTWGPARVCEHISVTHCRLSTASAGIKFSEGNRAGIRDIEVSHTLFNNVNRGVVLITSRGGSISNVLLSDLTINCSRFDWFWAGDAQPFRCRNYRLTELEPTASKSDEVPPGGIRNLTFRNLVARAKGSTLFYGNSENWLRDITFENVQLFLSTDPTAPYDTAEHALDLRRVKNLKLKRVEIRWETPVLASWKSALNLEEIDGLELERVVAGSAPSQQPAPAIALRDISGATISGCRALPGTGVFLKVTGPATHDIRLQANELGDATTPTQLGNEVPAAAVTGVGQGR